MKVIVFLTMFISLPAFSFNIENYPFEEFRDRMCKQRLCIDRGFDFLHVAGIDSSVKITRDDFNLMKVALLKANINPEEKDVLGLSQLDYAQLEYRLSEVGEGICELGKGVCAYGAMVSTLHWGMRAASLACLGTMPKCQRHYADNMKRLEELISDLKENEQKQKDKEKAGGGGSFEPYQPPGTPSFEGAGSLSLDCRMLPAYEIVAEGQTWKYEAEEVCKPRGGW